MSIQPTGSTPPARTTMPSRPKDSERTTRRSPIFLDRVKVLFLLVAAFVILAWTDYASFSGIKPVRDSVHDTAIRYWWLLVLAGLEVIRQTHYLIEEHSPTYYRFGTSASRRCTDGSAAGTTSRGSAWRGWRSGSCSCSSSTRSSSRSSTSPSRR